MKYYTGIGSRQTPPRILEEMTKLAREFRERGWTLRSGGAAGADAAFERGAGAKEIYLPWRGFNGNSSELWPPSEEAFQRAQRFHPAWYRCSDGAKKLHARNAHQVLGLDLNTPSKVVVCWTLDGNLVGGTAQALRIAEHYGIPVFNLGSDYLTRLDVLRSEFLS